MQINDQAILLKTQKFNEKHLIASVLSKEHGLIKGMVKNVYPKKFKTELIPGNLCMIIWKGRLNCQLGNLSFETLYNVIAHINSDQIRMVILNSVLSLVQLCINEREPHVNIYNQLEKLLKTLASEENITLVLKQYCFFELMLLGEAGFGLDLEKCAVTKQSHDLHYVSPRTGCAVSFEAAQPYKERLLELPQFIINEAIGINFPEILSALKLTAYFFTKQIYLIADKPEPIARRMLFDKIYELAQ
jgi:DNA repair protein RecO (recombination protein O)